MIPPAVSWSAAPFRYIAGDASLDFVNTADWSEAGLLNDRFTGFERVLEWAAGAGLLTPGAGRRFGALAAANPREAAAALREAREFRHQLRAMVLHAAGAVRREPAVPALAPALERFNALLARASAELRLDASTRGEDGFVARWPWEPRGGGRDHLPLAGALWPVARAAAALLTSEEAGRVRLCGGTDCAWAFVDRSRNGRRRWCEMEVCGTRAKERRRRPRSRSAAGQP